MAQKIPFFDLFKNLELSRELHIALSDAYILRAEVSRKDRSMALDMTATCELGERTMEELRTAVAAAYGLEQVAVHLTVEAPVLETVAPPPGAREKGELIFGGGIRGKVQSMEGLNPKMGQVCVEGRVFFSDLYETRRPGVFCLTFDMTDFRSSVRVTKYLQKQEKDSLKKEIKPGMWLRVQGFVKLDRKSVV